MAEPLVGEVKSPDAGPTERASRDGSVQKPQTFRIGGRVVTQDGFFAKIVGVTGGVQGPLLLDLDVAGIGLRQKTPASLVTPSDRRSMPRASRSLSPAPNSARSRRQNDVSGTSRPQTPRGALESRQAPEVTSGEGRQKVADVDTSFEDEAERFKRTSAVRTPTRAPRHLQTHI